jgi:hypothetical protein
MLPLEYLPCWQFASCGGQDGSGLVREEGGGYYFTDGLQKGEHIAQLISESKAPPRSWYFDTSNTLVLYRYLPESWLDASQGYLLVWI